MKKTAVSDTHPRSLWRSSAAVFLGFCAVVVLSLGTDQVLHVLDVYPPWGQRMPDRDDNLLALAYRCVYTVAGGTITAWLAPRNPMRHVLVLALVGFAAGLAGAIATIRMNLGPAWYPIALVVTALPCTWFGGVLYRNNAGRRINHAYPVVTPGRDATTTGGGQRSIPSPVAGGSVLHPDGHGINRLAVGA